MTRSLCMKTIEISAVPASNELFRMLARRKLIRMLVPTEGVEASRSPRGAMATIYTSAPAHGTHKLICVKPNSPKIKLNFHSDNEEFIMVNPKAAGFRPLYMIIGLHKQQVLARKIRRGTFSSRDLLAIRLRFNDPQVSIFTMLKDTPHCEITTHEIRPAPIFFVSEPSRLAMHMINCNGLRFRVTDRGRPVQKTRPYEELSV